MMTDPDKDEQAARADLERELEAMHKEKQALAWSLIEKTNALTNAEMSIAAITRARDLACFNITELNDQKAQLTAALNDALGFIDHMIGELHYNGVMLRPALMFAHKQFQDKMAKLLATPR